MDEVAELRRVREKLAAIPGSTVILEALFALAPVGIQIYAASGHNLLTNQAFRDLFGSAPPPEYNILRDEIAAANGLLGLVQRAFAGEVITAPPVWYDPRQLKQVKVTEGRRAAIEATFFPLRDADGAVQHVGIVFKDVTAELEKQGREEQARVEAEFLAECSAALAGCLDIEAALRSLAGLVVPHLADWCVIDMVAADGALRRVATAQAIADRERERLLADLQRDYSPARDSRQPAARVIETGKPELIADVGAETIAVRTVDERHRGLVSALQPRSILAVPLVARERVLGAITLAFAESGRTYGQDELRVATDSGLARGADRRQRPPLSGRARGDSGSRRLPLRRRPRAEDAAHGLAALSRAAGQVSGAGGA